MRLLRLALTLAMLAAFAAPAAFGASSGVVLRMLGAATAEHVCKCGMPLGKCGCPECDRALQELRREHAPSGVPLVKRQCDDDAPPMGAGATLLAVVPRSDAAVPVPGVERAPAVTSSPSLSLVDPEPPTPPPRIAAAISI